MAYHITLVTNNSTSSIAITNPAHEGDAMLVGPAPANNPGSDPGSNPYSPKRPILVNTIKGNPTYNQAMIEANNIYTATDNYCFWDNGHDSVNGIGQKSASGIVYLNTTAGKLEITATANGTLSFVKASSAASAGD